MCKGDILIKNEYKYVKRIKQLLSRLANLNLK